MMFVASLVLALFSVSNADSMGMHGCCEMDRPPQFSVSMEVTTAKINPGEKDPVVTVNDFVMDFDSTKNMSRFAGMIKTFNATNMSSANYSIINDYNTGKQYNFGVADGHYYCNANYINDTFPPKYCVPSNLTLDNTYTYGSGDESVTINSWQGMGADGLYHSVQTTVDGCLPVSYDKAGTTADGVTLTEAGLYANGMMSLSTPDAFKIPPQCMGVMVGHNNQ